MLVRKFAPRVLIPQTNFLMNRYEWRTAIVLLAVGLLACTDALSQTFLGVGVGAAAPTTQYTERSNLGFHGELQYGINRFCDWWPVITLNHGRYAAPDTLSPLTAAYPGATSFQANLRWFPWGSQNVPLYASLGTGLSVVTGEDQEGVLGMPGTIEAGYLLNYDTPCCDWFVAISARYTAYNMLRDLDRPHLSGLQGMIHLGIPLGGSTK